MMSKEMNLQVKHEELKRHENNVAYVSIVHAYRNLVEDVLKL